MSSRKESWKRLRTGAWCNNPALANKNDSTAKFMKLSQGAGPYKYDEYAVHIDSVSGTVLFNYLKAFAMDVNRTVKNPIFDQINVFEKRNERRIELSDIWDINIVGADNGSIVLVEKSPNFGKTGISSWIDIQTIECEKYGTHPECGAREFGFELNRNRATFYTRGVSRAYMHIHRTGTPIQHQGWTSMLTGIAAELKKKGAIINNSEVHSKMVEKDE
ncbi:MAG: hypothetical protein AB8G17_09740 [Gammaproteobacteria bacterium]